MAHLGPLVEGVGEVDLTSCDRDPIHIPGAMRALGYGDGGGPAPGPGRGLSELLLMPTSIPSLD